MRAKWRTRRERSGRRALCGHLGSVGSCALVLVHRCCELQFAGASTQSRGTPRPHDNRRFQRQRGAGVTLRRYGRSPGGDSDTFLQQDEFDLLSLRSFRREALLQYTNTNQSEPLRVLLFFFGVFAGACALCLAPRDASLQYYLGSVSTMLVSGGLFVRESGKRTRQLIRLEREYMVGDFLVESTDPATGMIRQLPAAALRKQSRLLILYGKERQLQQALRLAAGYRRRFEQSSIVVVAVASSGSAGSAAEAALGGLRGVRAASGWLWNAAGAEEWQDYFEEILQDRGGAQGRLTWAAFNLKGRVFGSDFGLPIWDELLAAAPPMRPVRSTETPWESPETAELLQMQSKFYHALCSGDESGLTQLFLSEEDPSLSAQIQVDDASGDTNLSPWSVVLAEGNRPELDVSSCDAVVIATGRAMTTCIEFPILGPTLLATQLWFLTEGAEGPAWKLASHRTIPYAPKVEARVALRCDRRGCIAFGKQLNSMR